MTKLEQAKKAYAGLVGRVDDVITRLEENPDNAAAYAILALKDALHKAEELFLDEDPEEEE